MQDHILEAKQELAQVPVNSYQLNLVNVFGNVDYEPFVVCYFSTTDVGI